MKFLKQRHEYLFEAISNNRLQDAYELVNNILSKDLDTPIYDSGVNEVIVKENGEKLIGRVFIGVGSNIGIRFNWKQGDKYSIIVSVDLWNDVSVITSKDPDRTIQLNGESLSKAVSHILEFFTGSPKQFREYERGQDNIKSEPGKKEEAKSEEEIRVSSVLDMDEEELDETNLDIFELIKFNVRQVAMGYANSLLITGQSGLGKSFEVEQKLEEMGIDFVLKKGSISTAGLYEALFRYNDRLLLFDDCDSVFKYEDSVNYLKGALDSRKERYVSSDKRSGYFKTDGMTMNDRMANYKGDISLADNKNLFDPKNQDKLPEDFIFTGKVIFISNISGKKMDPTIVTRATAHIDVFLNHEEILERMRKVIKAVHPDVPFEEKDKVLRLMDHLTVNYETRHPLSIRGLVNAISTKMANEDFIVIGGRKIPRWEVMIKQDMLGKDAKPRKKKP